MVKGIDYLKEDDVIPNQSYVCLSFLSPEGIKNCTLRGLKVRGVYSTYDEAKARAADLQSLDPDFDVFVGEIGKWLPWDPDPNSVKDQEYQEEKLNEIMKAHKDNLNKSAKMELQRKEKLTENATQINNNKKKKKEKKMQKVVNNPHNSENAKNKLREKKRRKDIEKQKQEEVAIKELDTYVSKKKEDVDNIKKELDSSKNTLNSIEAKKAEIKRLFEQSKNK